MNIVIGADPWAVSLKDAIREHLEKAGHAVTDVGSSRTSECPYYDVATAAVRRVRDGSAERGILLCGTGMGMAIVANKFPGIIASCVESPFAAKMCRAVNDANILTMGAMILSETLALQCVDEFLKTKHTETLELYSDFLCKAADEVRAIDEAHRK